MTIGRTNNIKREKVWAEAEGGERRQRTERRVDQMRSG